MRTLHTTCISLIATLLACAAGAGEPIRLTPNKSAKVDVPSGRIEKIMVSNPRVADARPAEDGKSVVIRALSSGSSEIRILRDKGEDMVYDLTVKADLTALAADISALLANVEGISVKVVQDRIILDGKVIVKSDYDRVEQIAKAYSDVILNLARLDRTEMNKFVAEAILKDVGLKTIKVDVSGDTATIEGVVFDPADAAMALEKAKQRCAKVVSLLRLEEIMIETDVFFVMIDTSDEEKSGFNILKTLSINAQFSATDAGASYSVSAGLMAKINELAGKGKAKYLATPHLSTKSGGAGRFHSGGESYFEVSGTTGGSLEKVQHGIILTVKPVLRGQDRVMNEITMEVSIPNARQKGAFALDKYETSCTTMSRIGESILISGLSQTLETQFKEKTPLLGDIPILNAFFREKTKAKTSRDLVVVITPRPVFPMDLGGEAFSAERQHLIEE